MAEDIVIRTIKIAVVAATILVAFIVAVRSQGVSLVAVPTQEVALLPEAEAHTLPTAVADAGGSSRQRSHGFTAYFASGANALA
jgi:hypothetical protein